MDCGYEPVPPTPTPTFDPADWAYNQSGTVTSSGECSNLSDYQVRFTLHYGSGTSSGSDFYLGGLSQPDFDDIRFTKADGVTLLDYWMEEVNASSDATVWVEFDQISPAGTDFYIHYGNPSASSASDGDATFLIFNDGTSITGWLEHWRGGAHNWSVINGVIRCTSVQNAGYAWSNLYYPEPTGTDYYVAECDIRAQDGFTPGNYQQGMGYEVYDPMARWLDIYNTWELRDTLEWGNTSWTRSVPDPTFDAREWHKYSFVKNGNDWQMFVDDDLKVTRSAKSVSQYIGMYTYLEAHDHWAEFDDFRVRNYCAPEPTISWGEEPQPTPTPVPTETPIPTPTPVFDPADWAYNQSGTVTSSGECSNLSDYQVRFTLHYGSGTSSGSDFYLGGLSQPDFDDIRFTRADGLTLLDYWMEEVNAGSDATVWVEFDQISPAGTDFYIHYGNPNATSASDGDATFPFFDDFEDGVIDTDKWTEIYEDGDFVREEDGVLKALGSTSGFRARACVWSKFIPTDMDIKVYYKIKMTEIQMSGDPFFDFVPGIRNIYYYPNKSYETDSTALVWKTGFVWADLEQWQSLFAWTQFTGFEIPPLNGTYHDVVKWVDSGKTGYTIVDGLEQNVSCAHPFDTAQAAYLRIRISGENVNTNDGCIADVFAEHVFARHYCDPEPTIEWDEEPPFDPADWAYNLSGRVTSSGECSNLSDYQMRFTVHYGSGTNSGSDFYLGGLSQPDFEDVRFTRADGVTPLDYWQEKGAVDEGNSSVFWVEFDRISPAGTDFYIHYGNPGATSASDGEATWDFFDDFDGTAVDVTKWDTINSPNSTVSGSELTINVTESSAGIAHGYKTIDTFDSCRIVSRGKTGYSQDSAAGVILSQFESYLCNNRVAMRKGFIRLSTDLRECGGDHTPLNVNENLSVDTYYTYYYVRDDASYVKTWENGVYAGEVTSNIRDANDPAAVYVHFFNDVWRTQDVTVDWLGVGKYCDPEPTISWGEEPVPTPTATATMEPSVNTVYFEYPNYTQDKDTDFSTRVNISFPLDCFYGAQFDLDWNHTLLQLRSGYTMSNGKGRLWNGSAWHDASTLAMNLNGPGPDGQGHAIVLVDWDDYIYMTGGIGINASAGYLCDLYWRPMGNVGVTDVLFQETLQLVGLDIAHGAFEIPAMWSDTQITLTGNVSQPTPTPTASASPSASPTATPTTEPVDVWIDFVQSPGVNVTLNAATYSEFTVRVNISGVENLKLAQYDITYDPGVVKVITTTGWNPDVRSGEIGGESFPVEMAAFVPPETRGRVRIIQNLEGVQGVSGSGYMSSIEFKVIGSPEETSPIEISIETLDNVALLPIPHTVTNSSVLVIHPWQPGDVDHDNDIDAGDITKLERILCGLDAVTFGADANSDGTVNVTDMGVIEYIILNVWPWNHVQMVAPDDMPNGDSFTASAFVTYTENLGSSSCDISYNASVLELEGVSDGEMMEVGPGPATFHAVDVTGWSQPGGPGTLRINSNIDDDGVNGAGYLYQIQFRVSGSAGQVSSIDPEPLTSWLKDAVGGDIAVTWGNDSVTVAP